MTSPDPPNLFFSEESDIPSINCVYRTHDRFVQDSKQFSSKYFSILNFNIRSCRRNFPSFFTFLCSLFCNISLIVLTETWLTEEVDCGFNIDGYNQLNLYRNIHGGGLKIFYNDNFRANIIAECTFVNSFIEVLTFFLIGCNFKYIICAIYRPPSSNPLLFIECLFNILSKLPNNSKVIIIGDINLNLYNPLGLNYIEAFVNGMLEKNFYPVITRATKINQNNIITPYSLLDQIWCNFKNGSCHIAGVLKIPISDHFPVYYNFNLNLKLNVKSVKYRIFSEVNHNRFRCLLNDLSMENILNFNEPNSCFNYLFDNFFRIYNLSFPIKKKKIKRNMVNAPWMTSDLKRCIAKKYRLFNLLRRGLISKKDFNTYKNILVWVKKKMRQHYFIRKFLYNNDIKNTWSNINDLLGRKNSNRIESVLTDNDTVLSGPAMVNYFNNYFTSIPHRLISNLPPGIDYTYFNNLPSITSSFYFIPTTYDEVYKLILSLPNKGNSLTDIKTNVLKRVTDIVTPFIVNTFNFCIQEGKYPKILKLARVVPVFKAGSKVDVKNYRPISNLSVFNKIFEKLTHLRICSFIDKYNLLSKFQFGFRKNNSTTLAIFHFISDLMLTFNKKKCTIALFLDLSRAFDTINKEILLHKLYHYGFRGTSLNFINSYLTERSQYVDINGLTSNPENISVGVPQGSVLGPLLFNLFINDVIGAFSCKNIFYADDGVFYVTGDSVSECVVLINEVIDNLSLWLSKNKLIPNTGKTKLMLFTPKIVNHYPNIYFNNSKLEWVDTFKYLGVILDAKLNFISHVKNVKQKLSKLRGTFYAISNLMPQKTLLQIYNSLVYSTINQNVIIWGGVSEIYRREIQVLMNKILKSILRNKYD